MSVFRKKLKKLKKNPSLFVSDMIKKRTGKIMPSSKEVSQDKISAVKSLSLPKQLAVKRKRANIFCHISNLEKIALHNYGENNNEYRVVCLFNHLEYKQFKYKELLERIYDHNDFLPMRRNFLGRGYYNLSKLSESTSVGRTLAQSNNLAAVNNVSTIFIFDCEDPFLFSLFRASSPSVNIVAIYTQKIDGVIFSALKSADVIDTFIVCSDQEVNGACRKILYYKDDFYLCIMIRKVIQEYLSKERNLLLPLIGGKYLHENLEGFNVDSWDGLIYLKQEVEFSDLCRFEDIIPELIKNIKDFYVTDKFYLKYKSLCDCVELPGNLENLIHFSLKDGALFDVKVL